jgi:hypothetical protein
MPQTLNDKQRKSAGKLQLEIERINNGERQKALKSAMADLLKSLLPPTGLSQERRPESDKSKSPETQYEEQIKHLVNWLKDRTKLEPAE